MYRPQFPYVTESGCRYEDFVYYFDGSNVPMLNTSISGKRIENIPLPLEQDAPFLWRGVKVGATRVLSSGVPSAYLSPNFNVRLRDCYDNDLSDDYVPATQYGFAENPLTFSSSLLTGPPAVLEPEIYCPPGGVIIAFLNCPTALGELSYFASFALFGVKRVKECR